MHRAKNKETFTDSGNLVLSIFLKIMPNIRGRGYFLKKAISVWPRLNNAKLVFENCQLPLDLKNNSDIGYFYGHGLGNEIFFKEVLLSLSAKDTVFYDIGSNLGYYSFLLSSFVEKCFAFEPNPVLFQRIRYVISTYSLQNLVVYNLGLSNQNKEMLFYINPSSHGLSSFIKPEIINETRILEADTLDNVIRNNDLIPPNLIKIDTEGNELDILEGYSNLLIDKPVILMEWLENPDTDDARINRLFQLLDGQYQIFKIGIESKIIPWNENVNFNFSNLLLIPLEDQKINVINKWLN